MLTRNQAISRPLPSANQWSCWYLLLVMLMMVSISYPVGAYTLISDRIGQGETIQVALYKSRVVQLDQAINKVSVGKQEIADILVMKSNQIYILGKGIGSTNIMLWDKRNNLVQTLDVEVTPDVNGLKAKLHQLMPNEKIGVHMSQGSIVLTGEVTSVGHADTAIKLAESFLQAPSDEGASAPGQVVNLMQIGGSQQVMLKVTVAEMSRDLTKRLGLKFHAIFTDNDFSFGAVNGGATFTDSAASGLSGGGIVGPQTDRFNPSGLGIADKGLFASYLSSDLLFTMAIDAAKNTGLAKILAEPMLTTLSGQEAEFLSGGEFPVPVPDDDGTVTIEFKDFGVGLKFLPVVLDEDKISLKLNVSVSELSDATSVALGVTNSTTILIPSITKRSAKSTVELGDGETIGIAGLLSETTRDNVDKFPGLGDVPVLGHLFRSQEYVQDKTELVILVTPTLAKPFVANEVMLPGDGFVTPTDYEFYLLGQSHGVEGFDKQAEHDAAIKASKDGEASITEPVPSQAAVTATTQAVQPVEIKPASGTEILPADGGSESTFGHTVN